jgi:predicted RNA binding protein YcfA (HicA-like mRNA interferase family)
MKRRNLEKHLRAHGCTLHHHGSDHDMWINPKNGQQTTIPRHTEVKTPMAWGICKQLGVPKPRGR